MNTLATDSVYQITAYESHRLRLCSYLPAKFCPEQRKFFASYYEILTNLPQEQKYKLKETTDAGVLVGTKGNVVEFPKALFTPYFDLTKRDLANGELLSWIEFLKEHK